MQNILNVVPIFKLDLKYILCRLRNSTFVKNTLVVMSGTAMAQAIGFALTPIISRLFSPSDFGIFGSFDAVFTVIAAGVTMQYSQAIILVKEKEEAINLFFISCLCTLAVGLLCLVFCLLAPAAVNSVMKTSGVWPLALLVAATIVAGLNETCQTWCVWAKAFKHTSASQVIRSLSSNGSQIGFGFLKGGAIGLIVSSVLANILASINLVRVLLPDILTSRRYIHWKRMKQLAKDYRDFPMYSNTQNVINTLSLGLPVLLLGHYYGIPVAGAYAFGVRIMQTPMSFVTRSLHQVLFQKACETHNRGESLWTLYVKVTSGLLALALFPSLVLFIWAPELFTWIFGSRWQTAGEFAQSLVLWMMFWFSNTPSVLFARIIRMQRAHFLYHLILLVARAMALITGGIYMSAANTIILFSAVGATFNVGWSVIVGRALMKKESMLIGEAFQSFMRGREPHD